MNFFDPSFPQVWPDLESAGWGAGETVALHPAGAHQPEDQEHPPDQRPVGEYTL